MSVYERKKKIIIEKQMRSKITTTLGVLIVMFCSCERELDDGGEVMSDDQISFRVGVADDLVLATTKGTPIDSSAQILSVGVYGFVDNVLYIDNRKAESESNVWSFSPAVFWPDDNTVDFIAYSPYADSELNGLTVLDMGEEFLKIEYSVPQTVENQPDLMVSLPVSGAIGDNLEFEFAHALATVAFKVKGDLEVAIESITISNVASKGVLSYNGEDISWKNESASTLEFSAGIEDGLMPSDEAQDLTLSDGYLMMLPQILDENAQVYIKMSNDLYSTTVSFESGSEWVAGECYTYVINTSSLSDPLPNINENGDYTTLSSSNCYILTPSSEDKVFYIPIQDRINTFWGDTGYEYNSSYMIRRRTSNSIKTQILWTDAVSIEGFEAEIVSSGYENTSDLVAMRVSLPANAEQGNIVVAVELDDVVLWSWHFWVTDYFPYNCYPDKTADYCYEPCNGVGTVSKFGGSMWAEGATYQTKYVMDRNVGAIGCDYISDFGAGTLFYQFGRKDPFPGSDASFVDYTDPSGVVMDGSSFLGENSLSDSDMTISSSVNYPVLYCITSDWADNSGSQYVYDEDNLIVWNDPLVSCSDSESEAKSIFDPSPWGWKIPNYNAWLDLDDEDENIYNFFWSDVYAGRFYQPNSTDDNVASVTNYSSFFPASGYMQTIDASLYQSGNYGVYWSSTPNLYNTGRTMLISNSTVSLYYNYCGYAFSVRSVME